MTPNHEGLHPHIAMPAGGWTPNTLYRATVAYSKDNMFHEVLIFVNTRGTPYVISPSSDAIVELLSHYYVARDIRLITALTDQPADDVKLMPQAYYAASVLRKNDADALHELALVFTGFLNGQDHQPGGYSAVILLGANPTSHEYRKFDVTLLNLITTDEALKKTG